MREGEWKAEEFDDTQEGAQYVADLEEHIAKFARYERVGTSFICVRPTPADLGQGRNVSCVANHTLRAFLFDLGREFQKLLAHFILEGLEQINEADFGWRTELISPSRLNHAYRDA
jgi:hypothetical protein